MSFNYLPLLVFILLAFSAATILFMYVKKTFRTQPRTLDVGLLFIGISAFMVGIYKIIDMFDILSKYLSVLKLLTPTLSLVGIVLLFVGAYNKVKFDAVRKRLMVIIIFTLLTIILLCGIIGSFAYFNK
jgi:hypothetical protein